MRKAMFTLMCLFAMLAAGTGLKAQGVTITIDPEWNWISFPIVEETSIEDVLAGFEPEFGDGIASFDGYTDYLGEWTGDFTTLLPGHGYMYYSVRTESVSFVVNVQPSQVAVTTAEPTDITLTGATFGGTVTDTGNSAIVLHGLCWGTEQDPTVADSHTVDFGTGTFTSEVEGLSPGTIYYVRAFALTEKGIAYGNQVSFTTTLPTYVDLGLPSGTLWATCNVGADSPEDYGDYFAWGETHPKETYEVSNYQYYNGNHYNITKYCSNSSYGYNGFTDNLTTLLPEDDAATANWGNDWRIPTKAEWEELQAHTTVTWTTQNGVNGCLFTATNGSDNSLFLPAAGYRYYVNFGDAGSDGWYLSSSLDTEMGYAVYFMFNTDMCGSGATSRSSGRPVRPVRSLQPVTAQYTVIATPNDVEGGIVTNIQQDLICTLTATANEGYTFVNWTENDEVVSTDATYTFTVTGDRTLVANFTANGAGDDHAYVDLGLPSGTLWATCNVGADSPEDYGDYFAWGETQPKDYYDWSTYQFCMGSENTLTKYCSNSDYGYNGFTDNLTTLLPEDDAATANWGADWRMPTQEEWEELYQNTTVTWTTQNGVYGRLFTASNGNGLFLPAVGYRSSSNLFSADSNGFYWSSSLNTDIPSNAWFFYFDSDDYFMSYNFRYGGQSVRPVRSSGQNNTPTGAINGKFSVSEDNQVYFSQGNLQYQASTDTWRFADNQWDFVGDDNANISETYSGWIDLFGWGTSGYNHGANCYQPWSTSESYSSYSDYYAYGNDQYNLYDQTGQADWGYNPIINGGNQTNQWRTLAQPEWDYIFNMRTTASGIRYAKAKVNNVNGIILLPDNWSSSTYSLSYTNSSDVGFSCNTISASQWTILESAGAVFLPAAGGRFWTSVFDVGSYGNYWSASYYDSGGACDVYFSDSYLNTDSGCLRCYGRSVRLVRVAENYSYSINAVASPAEGGTVSGGGTIQQGQQCTVTAMANEGYTFANWTENDEVVSTDATYTFTVTCDRALVANFTANGGGDHAYVDLGLPSGLLWATCNIGADNPEDYGDYFAWGETQPKDLYHLSTYQYCMGYYDNLTKYCSDSNYGYNSFTDNLTTLLPEDDAATANWGTDWRMPTEEEFQELYNNTTLTETTQNGVNGRLFTASNGNSLFLPAAGYRLYNSLDDAGSEGEYWSSSLAMDLPYCAKAIKFYSNYYGGGSCGRYYGLSVRPVRSASQN